MADAKQQLLDELAACTAQIQALSSREQDSAADLNPKKDFVVFRTTMTLTQQLDPSEPGVSRVSDALLVLLARGGLSVEASLLAATALVHTLRPPAVLRLLQPDGPGAHQDHQDHQGHQDHQDHQDHQALDPALFGLCVAHGLLSAETWLRRLHDVPEDEVSAAQLLVRPVSAALMPDCTQLSRRTALAFKVLAVWLQRLLELRLPLPPPLPQQVLQLVCASWHLPVSGVRDNNARALGLLLDLVEAGLCVVEGLPATQDLLARVLDDHPWTDKAKYFVLGVLLQRHDPGRILRGRPLLLDGLLLGAASTHLVSAASDVYRLLLRGLSLDSWTELVQPSLVRALTRSRNRTLVQNLLNHWVQPTVKAFPEVLPALLAVVRSADQSEQPYKTHVQLSTAVLLRLARRDGLWLVPGQPEGESPTGDADAECWSLVRAFLSHGDPDIRAHAFSALCTLTKTNRALNEMEFVAVKEFLEDNVSTDCSPLRQSLLSSFSSLLLRLKGSATTAASRSRDGRLDPAVLRVADFLLWLHGFLVGNLVPGCNYQRRITSLALYLMVVRYMDVNGAASDRPKGVLRKGNQKHDLLRVGCIREKFLFDSTDSLLILLQCVLDPTDDVRETAGTILLECGAFQRGSLADPACLQAPGAPGAPGPWSGLRDLGQLRALALRLCNSQYFYETESGALLCKILASRAEEDSAAGRAGAGPGQPDPLGPAALVGVCRSQLRAVRLDVLSAATGGQPLHGVLTALRRVLPRTLDLQLAGEIVAVAEEAVETCLAQLARSATDDQGFAPSFAEMGEAIDSLVAGDSENLTLTPAHQQVLNCIWLNLKASCSLASSLVEIHNISTELVERCARLQVSVLTRCRHKGAIESAGVALQQLVSSLTKDKTSSRELRDLPLRLLKEFLNQLLEGRTASGTSVSRRSAGMGILVHRIVSGDQQPNRPLLHECISQLFAVVESSVTEEQALGAGQHDIPQSQALHFLRTLVADASLRVDMAPLMCETAMHCFTHLASSVWSVRNAGLQLFGALVPKLVGQKKITETENIKCSGSLVPSGDMAHDELALRYPNLHSLLLDLLVAKQKILCKNQPDLTIHTDLIPAMSLLARLSTPVPVFVGTELQLDQQQFKSAFLSLLTSPVSTVRALAASAFARFTPLRDCQSVLHKLAAVWLDHSNENTRLGHLMAMAQLRDRLATDGECLPDTDTHLKSTAAVLMTLHQSSQNYKISYISRSLLLELSGFSEVWRKGILDEVVNALSLDSSKIGVYQWGRERIASLFSSTPLENFPSLLDDCLRSPCHTDLPRYGLQAVNTYLEKYSISERTLSAVSSSLIFVLLTDKGISNQSSSEVLCALLDIICVARSSQMKLSFAEKDISDIFKKFCSKECGRKRQPVSLPVVTGLCAFNCKQGLHNIPFELLDYIVAYMWEFCSPDTCNEDIRMYAAKSLRLLGPVMQILNKENRFMQSSVYHTLLNTALQLLQDEDSEIREEAAQFVTECMPELPITFQVNAYTCLRFFFSISFLKNFLSHTSDLLKFLWMKLDVQEHRNVVKISDVGNPFDHGTKNIYAEETKVTNLVIKTFEYVLCDTKSNELQSDFFSHVNINSITQSVDVMHEYYRDAADFSSNSPQAYLMAQKLSYQLKILNQVTNQNGLLLESLMNRVNEIVSKHVPLQNATSHFHYT